MSNTKIQPLGTMPEGKAYSIEVSFKQRIGGSGVLIADNKTQARAQVKEMYDGVDDLKILEIRELSEREKDALFALSDDQQPHSIH